MDFLKACTTNIHAIENLVQTAYCVYDWEDGQGSAIDRWEHAQKTVEALRRENVLCTTIAHAVWIFGHFDDEQKGALDHAQLGFSVAREGTLESPPTHAPDGRALRDILLEAIEHALAFALARDPAIVHVGPWLWLYHSVRDPEDDEDDIDNYSHQTFETSIIQLHTKFTSSGGLYLIPIVVPSSCQLMPLRPDSEDNGVILAPYGKIARLLPQDTDQVGLCDDFWKSNLAKALQPRGINLSSNSTWVAVELVFHSTAVSFVWPHSLCFARLKPDHDLADTAQAERDWRRWFISTEEGARIRNPLSVAEEWWKEAAEMERTGKGTANIELTSGSDNKDANDAAWSTAIHDGTTTMTSPPFSQRSVEQQTVMTGIYPTPPDGYASTHNASQLVPTTPSISQAEQHKSGGEAAPTSDDAQYTFAAASHSGQDAVQSGDQDMLFGDSGEIDFGEDDIGDADFSFFDDNDNDLSAMPPADIDLEDTLKHTLIDEGSGRIAAGEDVPADSLEPDLKPSPQEEPAQMQMDLSSPIEPSENLQEASQSVVVQPRPQSGRTPTEPEKPLSPFGIRERLLPPPVPASLSQIGLKEPAQMRQNNKFAPISFREGLDLNRKYSSVQLVPDEDHVKPASISKPDISLPAARKRNRLEDKDYSDSASDDESGGYSYEPSSSEVDEEDFPPRLPWETRKRKRRAEQDSMHPPSGSLERTWSDEEAEAQTVNPSKQGSVITLLEECAAFDSAIDIISVLRGPDQEPYDALASGTSPTDSVEALIGPVPKIEVFYDLPKEDLIYISQIINEQSVSALPCAEEGITGKEICAPGLSTGVAIYIHSALERSIEAVFPDVEQCDLGRVALTREPIRAPTNPSKPAQGPPRPLPRSDSMMLGPDYFHLPSPYVKIQRSSDSWEMLPSCLKFWEALGLGPTNGTKNVRAFCVLPENDDLQRIVEAFVFDLGTAYENCKLGSHIHTRSASATDPNDNFDNGMAPVELNEDASLEGALKAYAATCADLGKALSSIAHQEKDRAIVVYILNPFSGPQARQHLCACFWMLFKAYRDNLPTAQRNQAGSDIFLQLLPINMLASYDSLVVPNARQLAVVAREVYDRCPPSIACPDSTSALPILAAPAVELASVAPKRIGFQLVAEPPTDLLHEGSILHMAYSVSKDGLWMSVSWVDNTGKHQSSTSFCLRGRSFAEVVEDVWDCTRNILAARQVLWRVFIVTTDSVDQSLVQCWRSLSAKPRPQAVCVTLLTIDADPVLQLSPPLINLDGQSESKSDGGFFTPASTPQAGNFTSSPDVSGQGGNAPPTPAPSETAASIVDNEADAHLTDLTDETWGVLLSPRLGNVGANTGLANGALFRRGDNALVDGEGTPADKLTTIGVSVHWTIQVKPSGGVDEGSVKQAELTLREVLRMYRNLGLLARARGLDQGKTGFMPVHVAAAARGAEGLDRMLDSGEDT